jgi:hypothetical protein
VLACRRCCWGTIAHLPVLGSQSLHCPCRSLFLQDLSPGVAGFIMTARSATFFTSMVYHVASGHQLIDPGPYTFRACTRPCADAIFHLCRLPRALYFVLARRLAVKRVPLCRRLLLPAGERMAYNFPPRQTTHAHRCRARDYTACLPVVASALLSFENASFVGYLFLARVSSLCQT